MSASRRKGTAFETAVVRYLSEALALPLERRALGGARDRGDVAGLPGWVLECKAARQIDLAGFVDEARREAVNAGAERFAAVVKRRQKGVAESYVVMPLSVFADTLKN